MLHLVNSDVCETDIKDIYFHIWNWFFFKEVTGIEQNDKVEADVQQLMDYMKQRKQQLEKLLEEKNQGFRQLTSLENVGLTRFLPFGRVLKKIFFS